MLEMFKHIHSGTRWIVLILLILAIINALMKWQSGKAYTSGDKKINVMALAFSHIQLLIGLALMFVIKSPKVNFSKEGMQEPLTRFFSVEHFSMMLIAVILITIGYARAKRGPTDLSKHKRTFIFYIISLMIILYAIPWPWQNFGAAWF